MGVADVHWFQEWDWAGADREFRRALELNPDSLQVCGCCTLMLATTGRAQEAHAMGQRSATIDPLSSSAQGLYGEALYAARP